MPLSFKPVLIGSAVLAITAAALYFGVARPHFAANKSAGPVRVVAQPHDIWIEASDTTQSLNFDFAIENQGTTRIGIDRIELTLFDTAGKLVLRRFIDSNGLAPSIETIAQRVVEPGATILVFNPFHSFRHDVDLHRLRFDVSFSIPQESPETSARVEVLPRIYQPATTLTLPLKGLITIHDGHDFYAHHRRVNTEHPAAKALNLKHNFMRYSLDINPTDDDFELFAKTGANNADWFAWGAAVMATADGTVVDVDNDTPDNIRGGQNFFSTEAVKKLPMKFYGNHVVIDHGNGEFSLFGHLQQGSVEVKIGERVTRGQHLARIGSSGSSGSSGNPHLHYELRTGRGLQVEGLPAIFTDYTRHLGAKSVLVRAGPVDTGDMLEAHLQAQLELR